MAKVKSLKSATHREINILGAFMTSEKFCSLFCSIFKVNYFENPDYKLLFAYIKDYFIKYAKPPKKLIVAYMEKNKNKFQDPVMYALLKKSFLNFYDVWKETDSNEIDQYIIDDTELYIKAASIRVAMDEINLAFDNDDEESAIRIYEKITIPVVQRSKIITFETDLDLQREVLRKNRNFVIKFNDTVGELIGPLHRGDFFSFASPTGTGKSWWLLWCAKQCRNIGLNVLFLSLEMQEQSVMRRLEQMYYRRTLGGEEVTIARFIQDDDNKYKITHKKINAMQLKPEDINELKLKAMGKFPHGRLKIVCRAGINISDLKAIMSELKYQNKFIPDVIILDYADKMTITKRVSNERESIGIIWKDLRDLALNNNLLLITASQTNRASWDKHYSRDSIAEDSRKLNEASCMIGIMQDKKDRELGITMLRLLKIRDGNYESRDVYCATNYHIGQPCLQSVWANELIIPQERTTEENSRSSVEGFSRRRGLRKKK